MLDGFARAAVSTRLSRPPFGVATLRAAVMLLWLAISGLLVANSALAQSSQPRTVNFPSADGKTTLTGYLFAPAGKPKTAPAVVLMHGRTGAYSPLARGNYSAVTINKSIRGWAELWAGQGYWALVVDSFGPRGYPGGMAANNGQKIPLDEVGVRPLDAYGALRYLRTSPRIKGDRIALQGWSNGASAVIASMSNRALDVAELQPGRGFRAAVALYPGCGLQGVYKDGYLPYGPVRLFVGGRDEEVSPSVCQKFVAASKAQGGDIGVTVLEGATHDFDDPTRGRADAPANSAATVETRKQAVALFATVLAH